MSSLSDEDIVKIVEDLQLKDLRKLDSFFRENKFKVTNLFDWPKRENILHLLVRFINEAIRVVDPRLKEKLTNALFLVNITLWACNRKGTPNEVLMMVNKDGKTPYDLAKEFQEQKNFPKLPLYEEFVKKLYYKPPLPPLDVEFKEAIERKDIEKARELIEAGANINIQDSEGNTLLHIALLKKDFELANYLIDKGANPDIFNKKGHTALHICFFNNYPNIGTKLIQKKANINLQDKEFGLTPLMIAARSNNISAVKFLLESGANTDLENKKGELAIHLTTNEPIERLIYFSAIGIPIKTINQVFSQIISSSYKYPPTFSANITIPHIIRQPIQQAEEFYEILFRCYKDGVCSGEESCKNNNDDDDDKCGLCEYLEDETDSTFNNLNYGFLYYNSETKRLEAFTIFTIINFTTDLFYNETNKNKNKVTENAELGIPYGSKLISGILRCSSVKGLGRIIQSDIEDFARANSIPIMRIQPAGNLKNTYYKPKFNYVEHSKNKTYIYKQMKGGKRKTLKKSKRRTQRKK